MSLYCISVKTGMEEKFKESVLPVISGNECAFHGFPMEVSRNLWIKSSTMQYNVIMLFSVMAFLRIFVCAYSNFTENAFFGKFI